jgi:hypothetical protein
MPNRAAIAKTGTDDTDGMILLGQSLPEPHQGREGPGSQPGQYPDRQRAHEVDEGKWWRSSHREERAGPVDGDEGEIARRRTDQRGEKHAVRQVVLKGHLEGEYRPGGRRFEDGSNPGRGARHQESPPVKPSAESPEPPLKKDADGGAKVKRWSFQAHGAAEAERADGGEHPRRNLP